ncbi:Acyl-CoA dehydrogenase [Mesobacillus persicus]|uniref:Acyl-CoA dehydrogenase n=1 Tax=Mesobacillus persicus TaxID=930146 RepID=A0A1H8DAS0_9BACI|nr:acyl-CoA dehydrogenase family protein [Mesobacillus persicus]SEN04359.1 Acyl-CoA dehydrogenase [Mesobacillus persicus]
MDFTLSETQEVFKSTANKFFKEKCTITALKEAEKSAKNYSPALYKEIADLGFVGLIIPEEYGGAGGTFMDLAIVVEEAGYANLPTPFLSTIAYGAIPLLQSGTEEQKQKLLPRIAEGEFIFTGAFSEPQSHYDYRLIKSTLSDKGSTYSLNGKKLFVPFAESADYLLTLAKSSNGDVRLLLVKGGQPDILITSIPAIGPERVYEVNYRDVPLTSEDVLGNGGDGWSQTNRVIQMATALECIEMVGVLRRAVEVTNEYVKERRQFNRPIGSYQSVQHRLSDMLTVVEGGRLAAYQAMWRLAEGLPADRELAIAKAWLSKEGQNVLTGAHQLHGGMGIDIDYPLQFCFRRFKRFQLSMGTAPIHLKKIASSLERKAVATKV